MVKQCDFCVRLNHKSKSPIAPSLHYSFDLLQIIKGVFRPAGTYVHAVASIHYVPSLSTISTNMSDTDTDSRCDEANGQSILPFMLPPDSLETVLLLLSITAVITTFLYDSSVTHIIGILVLVLTAKTINFFFSSQTGGLFARIPCVQDASEGCRQNVQASLVDIGQQLLAWISGIATDERVMNAETAIYTEAGKRFLYRAGVIGAIATFILVFIVARVFYSTAYWHALASASVSVAELETNTMNNPSEIHENRSTLDIAKSSDEIDRSNPLISPDSNGSSNKGVSTGTVVKNPLKEPGSDEEDCQNGCCSACEALEAAQLEWIDAVRQYDEANDAVLEENYDLKEQMEKLRTEVCGLRQDAKTQYDRIEYLDVLLEEAGRQMGYECDM